MKCKLLLTSCTQNLASKNMDIQYVINAYACVMYIASYVLKAEKGMGELLKQAAKALHQRNTRQQLNKLGSVFLTNREVSAQEAVYRVLSMPLRRCSRTTVFLNTDHKDSRDLLLLPSAQLQKLMLMMKMCTVRISFINMQPGHKF